MSSYTIAYDEKYQCANCNNVYDDITTLNANSWRCPVCNGNILIAAPQLGSGHTLIRKSVLELEEYDLVHLPGSEDIYAVIAIIINKKTQVRVALRNFGTKIFNLTDFVSVVIGGYYEYHWK